MDGYDSFYLGLSFLLVARGLVRGRCQVRPFVVVCLAYRAPNSEKVLWMKEKEYVHGIAFDSLKKTI